MKKQYTTVLILMILCVEASASNPPPPPGSGNAPIDSLIYIGIIIGSLLGNTYMNYKRK